MTWLAFMDILVPFVEAGTMNAVKRRENFYRTLMRRVRVWISLSIYNKKGKKIFMDSN